MRVAQTRPPCRATAEPMKRRATHIRYADGRRFSRRLKSARPGQRDGESKRPGRINRKGSQMAELTNLESKLGEVVGLAMAAQEAGQKVAKLAKDEGNEDLVGTLERMRAQAAETAERGTEVASSFEGK